MKTTRRSRAKKDSTNTAAGQEETKQQAEATEQPQKFKAKTKRKARTIEAKNKPSAPINDTPAATEETDNRSIKEIEQVPLEMPAHRPPVEVLLARRLVMLQKYVAGKTPEIIAFEMNTKQDVVEQELDLALDLIIQDNTRHTPHHQWAKYTVFQLNIIRKLQEIHDAAKAAGKASLQSAVSALRTSSDIMDKIVDKGLDFGVIKKPTKGNKLAETLGLNPEQIKMLLQQEIKTSMVLLDNVDPEQIPVRQKRKKKDDGSKLLNEKTLENTDWMIKPEYRGKKQEEIKPTPLEQEIEIEKDLQKQQQNFLVPPSEVITDEP